MSAEENGNGLPTLAPLIFEPGKRLTNMDLPPITHNSNGVEVPDPSDPPLPGEVLDPDDPRVKSQFSTNMPVLSPPKTPDDVPPLFNQFDFNAIKGIDIQDTHEVTLEEQLNVLRHIILQPAFYEKIKNVINDIKYFRDSLSPRCYNLHKCIQHMYELYPGQRVSKHVMIELFETHCASHLNLNDVTAVRIELNDIFDDKDPIFEPKHIEDRLYVLLQQYSKQAMLHAGLFSVTERYEEAFEKYNQVLKVNPFIKAEEDDKFDTLEGVKEITAVGEKIPTGIWWMDDALLGGAMAGETIGILAPSGGGKTTLACELVSVQIAKHKHVCHISTEQGMVGDIGCRLLALANNVSIATFENGIDHWTDEQQEIVMKSRENLSEYHHFFDYRKNKITSIDALLEPVIELIKQGKKPDYAIIDWWGAIKDTMILALIEENRVSEAEIRLRARTWSSDLTKRANELGVSLIMFHQLAPGSVKKGGSINKATDAAEDKQFQFSFNFVFVFGPKDSYKNFKINIDKARRSENRITDAHLLGAFSKITKKVEEEYDGDAFAALLKIKEENEDVVLNEEYG